MDAHLYIALFTLGILMLTAGSHFFIKAVAALTAQHGLADLAVGLSLVAFCTSAPEFAINIAASAKGEAELVFANTIGSCIFNLFLVTGVAGLFFPLYVRGRTVWREIPFSMLIGLVIFVLVNDRMFFDGEQNELDWLDGMALLFFFGLFVLYILGNLKAQVRKVTGKHTDDAAKLKNWHVWVLFSFGLVALLSGSWMAVEGLNGIVAAWEVSKKLLGFVVLAPATSLPELTVSLAALRQGRTGLAIGNVIGSNLINLLLALPVATFIGPLAYGYVMNFDLYFYFFGVLLLFFSMFTGKRKKVSRWKAVLFLVFILGYVYFLFVRN